MLAFVFPGQGSQFVGMGRSLADEFPLARDTFAEASEALGFDLATLCFDGPAADLEATANAQPAILAASVAAYRVLTAETELRPTVLAGHSLGEFTAHVCAGTVDFGVALDLVRQRGQFMQAAVPVGAGRMLAVLGVSADEVAQLCVEATKADDSHIVSIANYNGSGQQVVSGHAAAVARVQELAQRNGAVCRALEVSAPFHCALMEPAADRFADALARVSFRAPRVPVIDGTSGRLREREEGLARSLADQVAAPVRWDAVMARLAALRVWAAVEVGPGARLLSMLRRDQPAIRATHFGAPGNLEAVLELATERPWLQRPLGHWRMTAQGDLFSAAEMRTVWAGRDRPEPVTADRWLSGDDGVRMHRYGAMALLTPEPRLRTFDPAEWFPREDGAYVRADHTEIVSPTGTVEVFDPAEWSVDDFGTLSRADGTRVIWADGSEWSFAGD